MLNNYKDGITYARNVVDRNIVTGKWIRLACERFLSDLDNDSATWYFDKNKAQHICSFFEHMIRHVKGDLAGKPYELSGWETFILINVFGFVSKENGKTRRFKSWLQFVARKNSKSTLSSGAVLYHLLSDGEEGAEAYSIATQRDQAKICWSSAIRMVEKMPNEAKQHFKSTITDLAVPGMFNSYKALGRDSKGLDGLNVSLALFDEAAMISDRNMIEVITSSQGSRTQYLNIYITTAQFNKTTVFYENYEYCKKILGGDIDDDEWFAAIYELDDNDRWNDEEVWIKANPNLGRSLSMDYLRGHVKMANEIPSKKNNFLVKHMNVWTSSSEAWLPTELWSKNVIDSIDRTGELWVGCDLGSTSDLTALSFLYRHGDKYHLETKCFIPEQAMENVPKYLRTIYSNAVEDGILVLTPGSATDFNMVKEYLLDYTKDKDLKEVAYDPWSALMMMTELLEEGCPVVQVNQSMRHLSPATKETEVHIHRGEILHEGNPFLQWQFDNCTQYINVSGSVKVRKGDDSNLKIDSIIAMILAVSRASSNGGLNTTNVDFAFF